MRKHTKSIKLRSIKQQIPLVHKKKKKIGEGLIGKGSAGVGMELCRVGVGVLYRHIRKCHGGTHCVYIHLVKSNVWQYIINIDSRLQKNIMYNSILEESTVLLYTLQKAQVVKDFSPGSECSSTEFQETTKEQVKTEGKQSSTQEACSQLLPNSGWLR